VSEIEYAEITTSETVNITELGVWLVGVTMIDAEPGCPATGWTLTPFAGPSVKSGMFTVIKVPFPPFAAEFA
jgi:hypothetical protein